MCAESVNNADVSTSCIGTVGGRGSVDVITSSPADGGRTRVDVRVGGWYDNTDVTAAADRENVCSGWRDSASDCCRKYPRSDAADD